MFNTLLTGTLYIGADNLGNFMNGYIDEVKISDLSRSGDWATTEYHNQNNPGNIGTAGFYTVSTEY